jgi:hypothetical protein
MATLDDKTIESTLRDTIKFLFRAGDFDNVTVKRIRQRTEQSLNLPTGWFKNHEEWRDRSSSIIRGEVENQELSKDDGSPAAPKSKKPSVANGKKRLSEDRPAEKPTKKQRMEKSEAKKKPVQVSRRKKTKVMDSDEDEDESLKDEEEEEKNDPSPLPNPLVTADAKSDAEMSSLSSLDDEPPRKSKPKPKSKAAKNPSKTSKTVTNDSESDLSSLIDDPPPKKKSSKPKPSNPKDSTFASKGDDEIKTLQGWLLKCGIRKKWATILAPYTTPKEKIQYLKSQLKDIGMDGRYSTAKAKEIKEQRELAAELDAVQEFANDWGKGGEKRGRRLAPRSRPVVEDDDGENGGGDADDVVDVPRTKLAEYDFVDEDSD